MFGLKEYADGEATLCTEEQLLIDDDLGALEAWLTGQDASNSHPKFTVTTHRSVPSVESIDDFDLGTTFEEFLTRGTAEPESEHEKYCSPGVVFEEDPLSCLLNTSNSFVSSQEIKVKKRGRKPKSNASSCPSSPGTTPTPPFMPSKRERNSVIFTPVMTPQPGKAQQSSPLVQYRQKRFSEDVYSPLLVRGRGADREGCCPLCHEPQVWLKIKQSAYWYHMNFYHGICASTGRPYDAPAELHHETIPGKPESVRVEGLCKDCNEWVIIVPEKPRLTPEYPLNSWYKHAQKCQSRLVTTDLEYPESLF
jgi:hypothetical protein